MRTRTNPLTGEVIEQPQIRDFAATLLDFDKGRLHQELSEALWDVIQAVEAVKKTGRLTLTLMVAPMDDHDGSPLLVKGDVKTSLPKPTPQTTVMYTDNQGNLSRSNPAQPELEGLRVIEQPTQPVRSIA
jgi:hypothetical protein